MSLSEKLEAARVALGKRKERELQAAQASPPKKPPPALARGSAADGGGGGGDNKLLAGQLAHEFLTCGTLLGRRVHLSGSAAPAPAPAPAMEQARDGPDAKTKRRYAEVSWLLMASGAHLPGVVNPTQLARWLKIGE
ncbi:hypothetical protein ACP4OV_014871 [Aristida adscensionis]